MSSLNMSEVPSLTPAGILFLHPGYNSPNNRLFRLPCNDNDSTRQISGVHHQTALLACQIIANNAFTGFLALDADGGRRADATVELHDILGGRQYYFIVPGNSTSSVLFCFLMTNVSNSQLDILLFHPSVTGNFLIIAFPISGLDFRLQKANAAISALFLRSRGH